MNPDTDKVYSVTIKGYIILDEHEDAPDWKWDLTKLVQALDSVTVNSTQRKTLHISISIRRGIRICLGG